MGASCGWRGVNPIRDQVKPRSSLMLIRWQTYRSKGGLYRGKTTRIRAILSKSIRVNGQSRQRFIAVIGSFVAERLDVEARHDFWQAAYECLSTYVPDEDRSRIEAALARRVPPLTAAEEAAWHIAVSQGQAIENANGEHDANHSRQTRAPGATDGNYMIQIKAIA